MADRKELQGIDWVIPDAGLVVILKQESHSARQACQLRRSSFVGLYNSFEADPL